MSYVWFAPSFSDICTRDEKTLGGHRVGQSPVRHSGFFLTSGAPNVFAVVLDRTVM